MDKKFVEENKFNEDVERFRQLSEYKSPKQSLKKLYEYTFITSPQVNEDGEDDMNQNDGMQQPQMGGGMDNGGNGMQGNGAAPGGMPPQQNMPNDAQNQMGGANGQMGGEMPPEGLQDPNGGMQQPQMDGGMDNGDGGMPDMDMSDFDDDGVETEEMEPDDEVIDVDELTQSQEATEYKIDGVDDRLAKIYAVVQKFSDQLERNEQSIMALKDEFEKRNPTEEEKLNIRSQTSYPYSETPKGYWDKKVQENPHYNVIYDNDVPPSEEQEKYEIKRGDISGLNMKSISDTLDVDQKLSNYLNF